MSSETLIALAQLEQRLRERMDGLSLAQADIEQRLGDLAEQIARMEARLSRLGRKDEIPAVAGNAAGDTRQ
jgi:uncharacterized small protein (DUF1192 family)